MRALASLACGFIFGWGLLISGMVMPTKVLGFLDIFAIANGGWDPSLAVVMAAALAVSGLGYALLRPSAPLLDAQLHLPTQTAIDRPLFVGSVLFASVGAWWGCARGRRSKIWRPCRRPSSSSLSPWRSA
jgi:hypothetical protein